MRFKLHDLVIITTSVNSIEDIVDYVGFVEEVLEDDNYRISILSRGRGTAATGRVIGRGDFSSKYLGHHHCPTHKKMLDFMLGERIELAKIALAQAELKKIIGDKDE